MAKSREGMESKQDSMDLDEESLPPLLSLPQELHYQIPNQASEQEATKIMAAFAKTCKHFNFFRVDIRIREAEQALKYAALARKKEVWDVNSKERGQLNKMLDRHPELLLVKGDVMVQVVVLS